MFLDLIGNSTDEAYERCHQDPMNKHELKYTYENHPDFEVIQSINSAFLCLIFGSILTIILLIFLLFIFNIIESLMIYK